MMDSNQKAINRFDHMVLQGQGHLTVLQLTLMGSC